MKFRIKITIVIILLSSYNLVTYGQAHNDKMNWWKEAKFGLFLHWGLYSVPGGDWKGKPTRGNEFLMLQQRIPLQEYAQIANSFNPVNFDARQWVKMAKNAGMKYIVITSKHHDGFAMYNSPSNDYNIVKSTPYKADPMVALAKACKENGLKLCFYYSLGRDWADPDCPTNWPTKGGRSNTWDFPNEDAKVFANYFERKVKPQVTELLTQYGPIGVIWFDTPELISPAQSKELRELILKLQPNCIINERIGNKEGDFAVSEQKLEKDSSELSKPWESCITMTRGWGYNRHDTLFKSTEVIVRNLIEVASINGNFLLNVSPTGLGIFPEKSIDRLKAVGRWMAVNSEAIYGTHAWKVSCEKMAKEKMEEEAGATLASMKDAVNDVTSQKTAPDIRFTAKGNVVYVFARSWRSQLVDVQSLLKGNDDVSKVQLLGYNGKIEWNQTYKSLQINLPQKFPAEVPVYTFKVTLKK